MHTERPPRDRQAHIPGEPGLWVLIFGDLAVFGFMFATFLAQRIGRVVLFERSQADLDRALGALNTGLLLTSSLLVAMSLQLVRESPESVRRNRLPLVGALLCAIAFVTVKGFEYAGRFHAGDTPSTNIFFTYYFVLTGLHLIHVVIGSGVLCLLLRELGRPAPRLDILEGGAVFWHLVDMLWIMLFALLYLLR